MEMIDNAALGGSIKRMAFVEDIRLVYAAADVLVLCSDEEGLGRCVVEAMASGVPVVVTDTGGTKEIVEHLKTGLVVPKGDVDVLAGCVVTAISDQGVRQDITGRARSFAERNLSSAVTAQQVMAVYDSILWG